MTTGTAPDDGIKAPMYPSLTSPFYLPQWLFEYPLGISPLRLSYLENIEVSISISPRILTGTFCEMESS